MSIKKETTNENYGKVIYDSRGYPCCHICNKSFKKLLSHVWQKHGLSEREYKITFGLDLSKGIICEETRQKLQDSVKANFDTIVKENLIKKGNKTRFKEGDKGRTKDKLSEQTKRMLSERFKNIKR